MTLACWQNRSCGRAIGSAGTRPQRGHAVEVVAPISAAAFYGATFGSAVDVEQIQLIGSQRLKHDETALVL